MSGQNKFGTFGGVFVPSILTILGVIMYLRLPMIVGESGLWATIGIIVVAHIISFTTGLSVSSIATDKKVEAGGTYFMISRSLGLPIGGTLGLALFVGLSFSVSLYLIGFSESFLNYWDFSTDINNIRITGTIVLIAVTTLTFISTSLAIKTQYFIMAAIGLSLLSIVFGNHDFAPEAPLFISSGSTVSLMVLFGIFFPAVTGFEAGVSMSGDLKDAKKSIPNGSIAAIVVGFVVYIALAFFFSYTVDGQALANDPQILLKISWIPELVIAGIWGATLSSALGSILGAPRILQATAKDRISPKIFGKGYGPTNEPRNALLLTFVIAEAGILIGELDVIARVVSIFFITTYGFLNISATFERYTSSDFRPEFKIPGWVSMIGAAACILVMIQLDFLAMLGAILILGLLFLYLKRKELSLDSGDAWSGVWASLVKRGLTNLKKDKLHKRNWRPNIIMFSGNPNTRDYMIDIGKSISGNLGILSAFELIESDTRILAKSVSGITEDKDDVGYFNHKLYCKEVYSGMDQIARVYGFSGIEPNTILMGWSTNPRNKDSFIQLLESFNQNNYNTLFLKYDHEKKFGKHKQIDIWWSGASRNLDLGINLVRYITNSIVWKNAKIRILIINKNEDQAENIYKATDSIITNYRIDAEIKIINNEIDPVTEHDLVSNESRDADLSIIGIPDQKFLNLPNYYDSISEILESNGTSLVINASNDFEHMEVIPDDSKKHVSVESQGDFTMEPLLFSKYNELNVELRRIDAHDEELVNEFTNKSFKPLINDRLAILNDLVLRTDFIKKEINKIEEVPDTYRRKKLIDKLKNEIFFKLNSTLSKENTEKLLDGQTKLLSESINYFKDNLNDNLNNSPKQITVVCGYDDFKIHREDSFSMKMYKRRKRFLHKFNNKPIRHTINYQTEAKHFQIDSKKEILYSQIEQFRKDEELFYKDVRKIINLIINKLDNTEREIWKESDKWIDTSKYNEIEKVIKDEIEQQTITLETYRRTLLLKFRETLQEMFKDLSKLNSKSIIKNKKLKKSFLKDISNDISNFPERRILIIKTLVNMILMELSINATKNRIEMLLEEFELGFKMTIENKFYKEMDFIIGSQKSGPKDVDIQNTKLNDNFEVEIHELFSNHIEKIIALTDQMPEELNIYSFKGGSTIYSETLTIPISRMTEYYLKSEYEVIVEDDFNKLMEFIKRSLLMINEHLNLTQFNIENITSKDILNEKSVILSELSIKLEQEITLLNEKFAEFFEKSQEQLNSAFEPLSSVKIEESATVFVTGLRSYQGKKVLTGISQVTGQIKEFFKKGITRLLYSRSEGILFAKKLSKSGELHSSISKILDFKDKVTPSQSVLNTLPPYYVTLFNGKSNIGKDFWINRKEEDLFLKAIDRYEQGYGGGILLLGDRNSGKTSFCRFISQQYLKSVKTYNLFPPVQGISSIEGFNHVLSKSTQLNGDTDQILGQIKPGSVIVINDLELFWERQEEGLHVIHHLGRMIDDYGQRLIFIVNINPHAYLLLNQLTNLADKFIEIINFSPFDAEDLKELILKRHRSSGLAIGYSANSSLNEVQLAQLFNSYFDYSEGNPGSALNGWLSNISKNTKGQLIIKKPIYPPISFIKNLDEDWLMILMQFILHKRLTHDKIQRITKWDDNQIRSQLLAMLRSGILNEKASGIYHINPFIHPFVIKALKEIDVLK